ncbi:pentatricopeptide repeat-containing protein At2g13600 isoform X2 [Cryptomeria japonica]|nr:pentatricopeptide repeat-containing protein At2g13600 isoform X2 [Cryptomeria japonica]
MMDARKVFDGMTERNVISWNTIIAAYRRNGYPHEALALFNQMQRTGVQPDNYTFSSILTVCAEIRALEQGINIHQSISERGLLSDVVSNALVDMYAKCGSLHMACEVFDKMPLQSVVSWTAMIAGYAQNGFLDEAVSLFKKMPQRDAVSWNAMIAGYAQNGFVEKALETFKQMQCAGLEPNPTTFVSILPALAKMGTLEQGMNIHRNIRESGFLSDVVVASALLDMYVKCGSIQIARELFDKMPRRNVVSWNIMIAGYAQYGVLDEALLLFKEMPQRNGVSWTAMISGYAQNGFVEKALETYKQMQLEGVKPMPTTFASILPACAKMGTLEVGRNIHRHIIEDGFLSDVVVASSLLDMYAKCGSIHKACALFNRMHQRDVVAWNAMIAGYAQNGFTEKVLETFKQMQLAGVKPVSSTFSSILAACGKSGALEQGMGIHQSIIENGFWSHVVILSGLVDMYAKCGNIHKARELFDRMPQRDVISWNAMIAGYAQNGFCKDALKLFELMKHSGTNPDHVTFVCVLLACTHAGLVDEGCKYFNGMNHSYCIMPTIDHYVCMVDLLGRAGYLEETLNFIIKMPIKPVEVVWTCLLSACRTHKNIELGELTADLLFELDPKSTAPYVLLSTIYADLGRWGEAQMVRRLMKERGVRKLPGCSWIGDHNMLRAFCVGEHTP